MWLLLCVVVSACGDESSPTAPTATGWFNGQWTGAQPPPEPYSFQSLLGPYSESDNTQITGFFKSPSENSGHGLVLFVPPGCGETIALWTATTR
jgi:hypothetical protein